MIIAGTGHRPNKLGGYDTFPRLVELAKAVLVKYQPEKVISGMALGWDQALAAAAIELEIPFIAAVPFVGQEKNWPQDSQDFYAYLWNKAAEVNVISGGDYSIFKMLQRNKWMVDHCDLLVALWNGDTAGGTASCVHYAQSVNRPMVNVWSSWVKYR